MTSKKKILIVDDQKINRNILARLLQDEYDVIPAENGKEALDIMTRMEDIAVVLLDLVMPELDGYGVLEEMQADAVLSSIPVIVATQ